jgi:uncharacterized membrane protein YtjA (UPF0391 family)
LAADLTGFDPAARVRASFGIGSSGGEIFCDFSIPDPSELPFPGWIIPAVEARRFSPRRTRKRKSKTEVLTMLSWVVTFLVIALIAGILGFGGIAGASIEIAKTIFFIAVVLFLVSAVIGLARRSNSVRH